MSRGFVKEEDQEEPPFIPPRAALPPGAENYVTANGYQELLDEKELLLAERKTTKELSERERRRENTVIDEKIKLLDERIHSAKVIEKEVSPTEVRFGVSVSYQRSDGNGQEMRFTIVGVDEADIKKGKVAFVAPIVQAMMGKKAGGEFEFRGVKFRVKGVA